MTDLQSYTGLLEKQIMTKITEKIKDEQVDDLIDNFLSNASTNKRWIRFNNFYFDSIKNKDYYNNKDFFVRFKTEYSLQGIDKGFLNKLEIEKDSIVNDIESGNIAERYFKTFKKAEIKQKDKTINKNLASFFSKLVHTFKPEDYCALDNPIKNFFGLQKDCFFVSFLSVSQGYKTWIKENKYLVEKIRKSIEEKDDKQLLKNKVFTDVKLLDLIFWEMANRKS